MMGRRQEEETTMSIKAIAGRVGLGSSKVANAKLHADMRRRHAQAAAPSQERLGV
jgi:hypothetical protein